MDGWNSLPLRVAGVGVELEYIFLLVLQWDFVYILYTILLLLYDSFLYFCSLFSLQMSYIGKALKHFR